MNCTRYGKKRLWPNLLHYTGICLETKCEERRASIWIAVSCDVWFIYSHVHPTNSMERVHSTFLGHSRNFCIWCNLSVYCFVQKSPTFVLIVIQINPIFALPSYLTPILILSYHLHLSVAGGLSFFFFASFPTKALYIFLFFPVCATRFTHHMLLVWSPKYYEYLLSRTSHEAPQNTSFSSLLLLAPS
jgi:hypothetical protein